MDDIDAHVGGRIRTRRQHLKVAAAHVAAAVGITEHELEEIESSNRRSEPRLLIDIAREQGVTLSYLYSDD